MSADEIDTYLAGVDEPKRRTLEAVRSTILDVLPEAEETLAYGMPAFKIRGKTVAGLAAFKNHLSYLPHSSQVLVTLADDVAGYVTTKGSLHFAVDEPLPEPLVASLIRTRLEELPAAKG